MKDGTSRVMQVALAACVGVITTGAGAWMALGQDRVTRQEVLDTISTQTPWVMERGAVVEKVNRNSADIGKLADQVDRVVGAQQELLVEQRVLVEKLDHLAESR